MIVLHISRVYSDCDHDDNMCVLMFTQKETLNNPTKLKDCFCKMRGSFLFDQDWEESESRFKDRFDKLNREREIFMDAYKSQLENATIKNILESFSLDFFGNWSDITLSYCEIQEDLVINFSQWIVLKQIFGDY